MKRDKRLTMRVQNRTFDGQATDWIGPVEHDHAERRRLPSFAVGCSFQDITQCADVGVKSAAGILDVEDQGIDPLERLRRRFAARAIEAVNRRLRRSRGSIPWSSTSRM